MAPLSNFKNKMQLSRVIFCLAFIIVAYGYLRQEKAFKDSILVVAKVTGFQHPKIDRTEIDVQYDYDGQIINNHFSLSNTDSLKVDSKIRLLVSRKHPVEFIKYVGVGN
ncbi:hypothetical protein [Mucilaginibacter sp. SG564]|uniref:hypothetical protein n=1 Tax=Mucilaginibacter sp. SG564 TaxID=2587022 RepID=UPI001555FE70|nr:hypothetical protein [Mucilaginibacter sp. SG564]NOW94156.1 hypothetical protein [Mucilaginibacter sp. SG564]